MANRPEGRAGASRYASIDALRGSAVAAMLLVNNPGDWGHVLAPLRHARWHGCTPTDLVFPFFLFVVGVSIAVGPVARAEAGADRAALWRVASLRALRIVALGLLLHLVAWWLLDRAHFRPWGVLQRIGLCILVAAPIALYLKPRAQWATIAVLLLAHWALLAAGGSYERYDNLADRIDTELLGPWLYQFDAGTGRGHDPEGLLGTFPAIATTLLGVRAGCWLRAGEMRRLLVAGIVAVAVGAAWTPLLPLNKPLWTSSFVLWTGGWAMLALAACHALVDRHGWPALGRSFGVNAITAYAGSALMAILLDASGWGGAAFRHGFAAWTTPRFEPWLPSLAYAVAFVLLWWIIVRAMDRRGWRLKI